MRFWRTIIFYLLSIIFYLKFKTDYNGENIMAQNSVLLEKSLKFSARIVNFQKYLIKEKREAIIQSRSFGLQRP